MTLTHSQKKYIKRNIKTLTLIEISSNLKIPEKEIKEHIKSQWRKDKYQKLIERETRKSFQRVNINLDGWFKRKWHIFVFLSFLVLAVYFNSLTNDFLSDDISTIRDSTTIDQVSYFFKPPYFNIFNFYLHPFLSFLTHKTFGMNPLFYRLPNILFHLGSTWLIFLIMNFFFKSPVPLFTASFFAVHPVLVESVSWISGGTYSNGAFFAFLSFFTYLQAKSRHDWKIYTVSVVSFLVATLFLDKLFVFPIILLLYEFCFGNLGKNLKKLIPFLILGGLLLASLLSLFGGRATSLQTTFYEEPGLDNPLVQIPMALTTYFRLIFWPQYLSLYYTELLTKLSYLAMLAISIIFAGIVFYSYFRNRKIFFWLSFFFITLSPTLTPLRIASLAAERYVYIGSVGIFAVVALGIKKLADIKKMRLITYGIFTLILIALSARTIARNFDWRNQDFLWLATEKAAPTSPQNYNNLGDLYTRQGNYEKAVEQFKKAIALKPNYGDAYHNMANAYHQMNQDDLALEGYLKAISFNPNLWQSYQNIAATYFVQKKYDLARDNLEKAISINPKNPDLYAVAGIVYLQLGNKTKAKDEFQNALQLDPDNQKAKDGLRELSR